METITHPAQSGIATIRNTWIIAKVLKTAFIVAQYFVLIALVILLPHNALAYILGYIGIFALTMINGAFKPENKAWDKMYGKNRVFVNHVYKKGFSVPSSIVWVFWMILCFMFYPYIIRLSVEHNVGVWHPVVAYLSLIAASSIALAFAKRNPDAPKGGVFGVGGGGLQRLAFLAVGVIIVFTNVNLWIFVPAIAVLLILAFFAKKHVAQNKIALKSLYSL